MTNKAKSKNGICEPLENLSDDFWMEFALEEAKLARQKEEVPIGAIILLNNEIIGRGHNQPIKSCDPTAHAEIIALREAAQAQYDVIRELRREQQRLIDEADRIQRLIDELERKYQDMTTPRPENPTVAPQYFRYCDLRSAP